MGEYMGRHWSPTVDATVITVVDRILVRLEIFVLGIGVQHCIFLDSKGNRLLSYGLQYEVLYLWW